MLPAVFEPTVAMRVAKAKLHAAMEEASSIYSMEALTVDQLVGLCGTSQVRKWLESPHFAVWLTDSSDFFARSVAYSEVAQEKLYEIMTMELDPSDRSVTAKDQLAAAKELLALAGKYPSKKSEVRFLDKDLDKLEAHEVDEQLRLYRSKLDKLTE